MAKFVLISTPSLTLLDNAYLVFFFFFFLIWFSYPGKKIHSFSKMLLLLLTCPVVSDSLRSQAPPSVGFSRQKYWSELPFPSQEDVPNAGTKPTSPALAGRFFSTEPLGTT